MNVYKEYIGCVEFHIDGVLYELSLRELEMRQLQGTWNCHACSENGATSETNIDREIAIGLAKAEAKKHHRICTGRKKCSSIQLPPES